MKRWRQEDHWFEIRTAPDPATGRPARYLTLRCRVCNATASIHANGMSQEKMRKNFVRRGWQIGRTTNAHLCSACQKLDAASRVPPPPRNEIYYHWSQTNHDERLEFLYLIAANGNDRSEFQSLINNAGFLEVWKEFVANNKPTVESSPPEPAAVPVAAMEPEPEPIDEDDAPADWWAELAAKRSA